jgi:SAM-dependent methyltransferase
MTDSNTTQFRVEHEVIQCCRSCESQRIELVLDFGETPLADRLLNESTVNEPEPICPLSVVFCHDCSLLQIRETVPPEILFSSDYPYFSSVSDGLMRHFKGNVDETRARKSVDEDSLVVEVASNDGYLLRNYKADGIPVLGIDPTDGPVREARALGIETIHEFFTSDLADSLRADGRLADIVHGNNVLAHVADTNGFVSGIAKILKDDGVVVIECPYVHDLIQKCEFDTIYHQHLCYFSLHALRTLFERHELYVNDVQRIAIHGGSLRLFIGKNNDPAASVRQLLKDEVDAGVTGFEFYRGFVERIDASRDALIRLLDELKAAGARIAGYGAPAKGCTLMAYMGIGANYLDYIVDKSRFKQGLFYAGNRLPIHSPEYLLEDSPDYALLLSWNFADEILKEQDEFRRQGGKFVVPIPELSIR